MAINDWTPKPGDLIGGKYTVEKIIGQGGTAYVVSAQHELLRRRVALKFLRPELAVHEDVCRRFVREAQNAGRLKGDHAARILDVDALPTGLPYLVMEYLEGEDLAAVLRRHGRLPASVVANYAVQACEAVSEAHALRIIHRDIKPSNLFLTEGPRRLPFIKVLDFGLSKVLDGEDGTENVTDSNRVMGSPHFMSPEQFRSPHEVDERTDVWSLGATLFTLLTGHVPFDGRSLMEVCAALLCGPQPRVERFCSDIPPGLESVVLRCLRLDPKDRYPSTAALVHDLGPFAGSHAIAAFGGRDAAPNVTWFASTERSVGPHRPTDPRAAPPISRSPTAAPVETLHGMHGYRPTAARVVALPALLIMGVGAIVLVGVAMSGRSAPGLRAMAVAMEASSASGVEETLPPSRVDGVPARVLGGSGAVAEPSDQGVGSRAVPSDLPRAAGVPRLFASAATRGSPVPSERTGETAAGDANCGHPFYIDSRGIKTIRRECM